MAQVLFALDGNDGDVAGVFAVGIGADFKYNLLAGRLFEEAVDVVGGVQVAAVDGEDVVSGFDVDAGLGQRSLVARDSSFHRHRLWRCDSGHFPGCSRRRASPPFTFFGSGASPPPTNMWPTVISPRHSWNR